VKENVMNIERKTDHPIDSIFIKRWSPRAFDAETMPAADLLTILEAARWAPSAYNVQPWRFLYALRDDTHWSDYLRLLDPFNASWAQRAAALIFLVSDTHMPAEGEAPRKPSRTHSLDVGAAWAQLALQATLMGYQAHAMAGIRYDQVREKLAVPADYRVEIAIAIGKPADKAVLPEVLQAREQLSLRRPLNEIAFAGGFPQ